MDKKTIYNFSKKESLSIMEALQDVIRERKVYLEDELLWVKKMISDNTDFWDLFNSEFEVTIKAIKEEED